MGISMYNGSGYRDPTAFEAINRAESFQIDHRTGYIRINMDTFFPCSVKKAQKLFRLVCMYCNQEQQDWLMDALQKRGERMKAAEERLKQKVESETEGSETWRDDCASLRRLRSSREQLQRNIRDFELRRRRR